MTAPRTRLELALDTCSRPTIGPRRWGAYFTCGLTGYVAGTVLTGVLGGALGLSTTGRLIVAVVPPASLLLAIKLAQIVFGRERIVFYEQAMIAVAAAAIAARAAGAPVATTIDLVTLGVGCFLAFGRIGCFRVACCHGRRARRGVRYRDEHARAGFPARWVGHPIAPLQLVDGALSAALVVVASWLVPVGAGAGLAATVYVAGYGVGRSVLELARGDAARASAGGVTEAQWIALVTTGAVAAWRPAAWSIGAAAIVALVVSTLLLARRTGALDRLWLAGAWHADEVSAHLDRLAIDGAPVTTREGLFLSAARLPDGRLDVIASRRAWPPSAAAMRALAAQLGRPWSRVELVPGRSRGLFHLLLTREEVSRAA